MRAILQHIQRIIDHYDGSKPLSNYLKAYFKKHPILGSRDRKMLTEMSYVWYRCSNVFDDALPFNKKLEACLFLCDTQQHQILQLLKPEWQGKYDYFFAQKISVLQKEKIRFDIEKLLPMTVAFSSGMQRQEWLSSMFIQPNLFIRYRKNTASLKALLDAQKWHYTPYGNDCFALPNGTKLETILPEKDYVVQDKSSQETRNYFAPKAGEHWWDCCAGAGGKSLLLHDLQPKIKLTVSDKRDTILHNLKTRFELYNKPAPEQLVADVADASSLKKQLMNRLFDNIICDVPCSGSGTWARTPEQLHFFEVEKIQSFASLQKHIAENAAAFLKPGGRLIYITCSVFKDENENVCEAINGLTVESMKLINGIAEGADSMFVAVLKKEAIVS